jgi:2-polyprenyl-6-methoxyphenol hydroxylase-like FAD-dependent oxidoreductase
MAALKPITIVGGGLAGLTLGIGLRRRDVPVTVWEAGNYPRHRVCGEFISGNGQAVLGRIGLLETFEQAGAFRAHTAMFVCGGSRSPVRRMDTPALCLSRHAMDALLAGTFQQLGGALRVDSRWTSPADSEGTVLAAGRRAATVENGRRWFGIKAHVSQHSLLALEADLEMHATPAGYVGVNRINGGETNVCGLLSTRHGQQHPESREDWLRGEAGSLLRERLHGVEFVPDSFCSVGGISLKPRRAASRQECCIGDSLTMTPPVTGNGMSMAFEAAELALDPLTGYSRGEAGWAQARRQIARSCDAAFSRRLAWARFLQWMMISPVLQSRLGPSLLRSHWVWRMFFARTR